MGILSNIFGKIFPSSHAAPAPASPSPGSAGPTSGAAGASSAPVAASAAPVQPVDVEAILNEKAQKNPQKLNWRTSIVDLLKLLDLDSSLGARKELAQELNYSGDMNDSASMNIWLHKQVMNKLAANGGKVPADLKD
ncbi:MAG: hypothetical protein JWR25_2413 [Noviherbaspirillum sp.]|jgi:hypothetical protein|nr:hypothetical protein [Noviherbaspirillum sp.]